MKKYILVLFTFIFSLSMFSFSANAINTGQLPLPSYPANNSYFSINGQRCAHHVLPNYTTCDFYGGCECRSFANSIQCMGFAKYAYSEYSNMTNFSTYYSTQLSLSVGNGDVKKKAANFSTTQGAKDAFTGLKKGDYVRMKKRGCSTDTGGNGHSFVILSVTNTNVTVYEANYDQVCGVSTRVISYSVMKDLYDQISFALQHKYSSTYSRYNATYHVRSCSTTNCTAKEYQQHYATTPGPNAVCLACGYRGNISIGYNSLLDENM